MNIVKHFARCLAPALLPAAFIVNCTGDPDIAGGTTETTSAEITGTIWNDDGTLALGVTVKLVPADFNPYSASNAGKIDSTITDDKGTYEFDSISSGFYNMSARSGAKYCYEDSVWGSEKYSIKVRDDTLRAPGSIRGVAQLQSGGDNLEIIILVLGTNTYTMTDDSMGAFTLPVLAEGDYVLRLLTTDEDYGCFDTTVSVAAGETTVIPGILRLPYTGVPSIGPVAVQFDPRTMYVTLSWPPCDTSNVAALYVFRNTGITSSPFAIVNSTGTSFTDDVVLLDSDSLTYGDTLRYCVAAFGKNRTLGKVGITPDILLRSFVTLIDTISLVGLHPLESGAIPAMAVDINHYVYLCGGGVSKVDSLGRVVAKYTDTTSDFGCAAIDRNGYVYYLRLPTVPFQLTKLSPDLKPLKKVAVDNTSDLGNYSMTTDDNGLVYIFLNNGQQTTFVKVFDSSLSIVQSATIPEFCFKPAMHDDTFYIKLNDDLSASQQPNAVKLYDTHGNFLQSRDLTTMINAYYPASSGYTGYLDRLYFTGDHTSLLICNRSFLISIGTNDELRGRCRLKSGLQYEFDGIDRIYVADELLQTVYVYKID